jgi:outer membrane protein assembly factor BamB
MTRTRIWVPLALLAGALALSTLHAAPGDWPCWRGPDRTGLSPETGLLKTWPAGGPRLLWKITGLGDGYSTPSIAGDRSFVMGSKGRTEQVIALELKDGKRIWGTNVGSEGQSWPGPRSTPTVDGDRVYAISSNGNLVCLGAGKGNVIWKKSLLSDFGGRHGKWNYAESPLIDGDNLICAPGGSKATIVALDKKTGRLVWKSAITLPSKATAAGPARGGPARGGRGGRGGMGGMNMGYNTASYASAIVAEFGGVRQYVHFLHGGVVGVDAADGKLLWNYDRPAQGSNANAATPIVHDGTVFAASAYRNGGGLAKIVKDGQRFRAEQVYFSEEMQNHHGGMLLIGGYLYGTNNTSLVCLEFRTGKVMWTNRSAGKGSIAYADGHLVHRGENGTVVLVEANSAGFKQKGRFDPPGRSAQKAWPHPVIAGGKMYLRDWDRLFCYDVKAN